MAEAAPAATGGTGAGLERVETAMETLAGLHGTSESLGEVAHDARNMVTALELYCDLLEEPGVLNPAFNHYAHELRLVAAASRRLVEKLLVLDAHSDARPDAQLDLPLDAWPQPENGFSGTMKTTMTEDRAAPGRAHPLVGADTRQADRQSCRRAAGQPQSALGACRTLHRSGRRHRGRRSRRCA